MVLDEIYPEDRVSLIDMTHYEMMSTYSKMINQKNMQISMLNYLLEDALTQIIYKYKLEMDDKKSPYTRLLKEEREKLMAKRIREVI